MTDYLRDPNGLPGMWEAADFMGGDPDERSYAERERDAAADAVSLGRRPILKANRIAVRRLEAYDDSWLDVGNAFLDLAFEEAGVDPADTTAVFSWGNPEPVRLVAHNVPIEILELMFGGGLIPLCERQIPAEGTE